MLLSAIIYSIKDIQNFSILLYLFMFVYILIGMELYSNQIKYNAEGLIDLQNGTSPRLNFDNFLNAFVLIFCCLHKWDEVLTNFTRIKGNFVIFFIISYVTIG